MKEITEVNYKGLGFIAVQEGCVLKPYLDSAGIATIGIGCTYYEDGSKVKITDKPITLERAYKLYKNILLHFELTVYSVTRDDINQNQFNALVSICFNIGVAGFKRSTLLKRVNSNRDDKIGITAAFRMWRNSGKKKGILLERRKREAKLYFKKVEILVNVA